MEKAKIPLLAHTSPEGRELLEDHLQAVALRAQEFAQSFDAADLGFATGFLHDLGKAKPAFQRKLLGESNSEPHSTEGARFACEHYNLACPLPFHNQWAAYQIASVAGRALRNIPADSRYCVPTHHDENARNSLISPASHNLIRP